MTSTPTATPHNSPTAFWSWREQQCTNLKFWRDSDRWNWMAWAQWDCIGICIKQTCRPKISWFEARPKPSVWVQASRLFGLSCLIRNSSWWSQDVCLSHSRPINLDWQHVVLHSSGTTACWTTQAWQLVVAHCNCITAYCTGGTTEMAAPIPVHCHPFQLHCLANSTRGLQAVFHRWEWQGRQVGGIDSTMKCK